MKSPLAMAKKKPGMKSGSMPEVEIELKGSDMPEGEDEEDGGEDEAIDAYFAAADIKPKDPAAAREAFKMAVYACKEG